MKTKTFLTEYTSFITFKLIPFSDFRSYGNFNAVMVGNMKNNLFPYFSPFSHNTTNIYSLASLVIVSRIIKKISAYI